MRVAVCSSRPAVTGSRHNARVAYPAQRTITPTGRYGRTDWRNTVPHRPARTTIPTTDLLTDVPANPSRRRALPTLRQRTTKHTVVAQAAAASPVALAAAAVAPSPSPSWPGAKLAPLMACVSLGLVLNFAVPTPAGITQQGWTLLSIFVSTIAGLVLEPLPVGAWAFLSATVAIATKTLSFTQTFSAFTNDVIWLIVVSFFFAKGFEKTGLGARVAQIFVKFFGKSTLGLAYGAYYASTNPRCDPPMSLHASLTLTLSLPHALARQACRSPRL